MRGRWGTAAAVFMLCVIGGGAGVLSGQQVERGAAPDTGGLPPALVGTWSSEPDRMRLMTDLEQSVWGTDASSVRIVDLRLEPSGEGFLTVTRKIVDAQDQPKPASVSVEAVHLKVGASRPTTAGRLEHAVEVLAAERRYPDEPEYRWPVDGVRVRVVGFEDDPDRIEVRFDTPEGRGSFWETLRQTGRPALLTQR